MNLWQRNAGCICLNPGGRKKTAPSNHESVHLQPLLAGNVLADIAVFHSFSLSCSLSLLFITSFIISFMRVDAGDAFETTCTQKVCEHIHLLAEFKVFFAGNLYVHVHLLAQF